MVQNSNRSGIRLENGSFVKLAGDTTIKDSGLAGIAVFGGELMVGGKSEIKNNGSRGTFAGVFARLGSIFLQDVIVTGNTGPGLWFRDNSVANIENTTVTENVGGFRLHAGSRIRLFGRGVNTVEGNGQPSVECIDDLSWVAGIIDGVEKKINCIVLP